MIFVGEDCETGMSVDGINNKLTATDGIGVTDANGGHDVVNKNPCKPTYSTSEANFR